MSIRLLESFDYATTPFLPFIQQWDSQLDVAIVADEGASGFSGDDAAYFDTSLNSIIRKAISPVIHDGVYTVTHGIRLRPMTLTSTATVLSVKTAISSFDLKMTQWGSLELYQVTGGNPLGRICQTADGIVPVATGGIYVEIQFIFDTSVANPIQIRVSDQYGTMNRAAEGSFYALAAADLPSTELVLGGGVAEDPATWFVDDVYMTDGVPALTPLNYQGQNIANDSFLGNTHLTTFYMSEDGAAQSTGNTPWVPNLGSSVAATIQEHPPDEDVTYSSANAVDQRSTGLYESPTTRPFGRQGCCAFAPIFALLWLGRLRMEEGTGTVVPVIRRISGGTFDTDIVGIGDEISVEELTYLYYPQVLERDPTNLNLPFTFAVFFPAGVGIPGTVEFGLQKTG